MKKPLLLLIVSTALLTANAQYIHKIKADSVLITNDSCTAELNLENSTKHIKGFLYNKGNGRTEFRKAEKLNDSTIVFGEDTIVIGGAGNGWLITGNAGTTPANNFLGTTDNQALAFRVNNTELMRMNTNGRIGIGTTSPASLLHIMDTTITSDNVVNVAVKQNSFTRYIMTNPDTGINAATGALYFNNANQALQLYCGSTNNVFTPNGALIRFAGPGGLLLVADNGPIAFGRNSHIGLNEFARFLNNGNLGIGTQTPQVKLHVAGKGIFTDTLTAITMGDADSSNRVATTAWVKRKAGNLSGNAVIASITTVNDQNYAVAAGDYTIIFSNLTTTRTITLPAAASHTGRILVIVNASTSESVSLSVAVTVDDSTGRIALSPGNRIMIQSDGADWWEIK